MDPIRQFLDNQVTRRRFLQASAATAGVLAAGGSFATRARAQGGTFNWMTWSDHFYQEQLDAIAQSAGITPSISELAANEDGFAKLQQGGSGLDLISGDALWVPAYRAQGLIDAWDINELEVSKTLFPVARDFDIWTTPDGYLGYPFGWSPVLIYYNKEHVTPTDSYEILLDPKYAGKVIMENQPTDVVAHMGILAGAADPYNMTDEELAAAKDLLWQLKPNILRFAQQNTDSVNALVTGEAWLATVNLGTDERVKEAGGPDIGVITPAEGTIGWMDAEMIVTGGANSAIIRPFLELSQQPEHIAENFLRYGRPLFNEGAYKILVDNGHQERADRFLYNKPETVLTMALKGPGQSTGGAIEAFNEVFAA